MSITGPPYTALSPLPALVRGRARNYPIQLRNSDGTPAIGIYTTATALACNLIPGDDEAPVATPATVWLNGAAGATAGQVLVQCVASDTATVLPGNYRLEVVGTTNGQPESLALFALPILDAAGTATGDPLDLVTMATVQGALAEVLATDQSWLPSAITAASVAVQRYCRRWFPLQTYIEIKQPQPGEWDKGQADLILLSGYPVIGTPILKSGWTNALQIQNTSAAVQEAWVGITTSGDPQISVTNTGLALTAIANGVATTSNVSWTTTSPYTTIQSVVNTINGLGNGWLATLQQPSQAGLGAYNLYGSTAVANAISPGLCMLSVFANPLAFANVEVDSGCVWLAPGAWYGGYGQGYGATASGDWLWAGGGTSGGGNFRPPVLCTYTAGYSTIPQDIQEAVLIILKTMMSELGTNTIYETETTDRVTVKLASIAERVMPQPAKKLLSTYRAHRVS